MDMSRASNWTDTLNGQVLVCGVLSKALYSAPDRAWLDTLIDHDVFAEFPLGKSQTEVVEALALLQNWSRANRGGLSRHAFEEIAADFTRLFVGPGKLLAAPWESVYADRDRVLFQPVTVEVRNWYARFELVLASGINEPEDHVGLELGFLAHLAKLSLEALKAEDAARLDDLIEAQRSFVAEHPLRWVPKWSREMNAHARTDFFKGMGRLACGVVKQLDAVYRAAPIKALNIDPK